MTSICRCSGPSAPTDQWRNGGLLRSSEEEPSLLSDVGLQPCQRSTRRAVNSGEAGRPSRLSMRYWLLFTSNIQPRKRLRPAKTVI